MIAGPAPGAGLQLQNYRHLYAGVEMKGIVPWPVTL